ncbi:homocysteine S-methyltransferase [Flammeovirga kamogawensis]|uniref:Homocysteine S-methyltransferase n=1 Tax=Flammeovirga kamogawensis TaxID=373891 RepID=A0ABX8GYC4_9BACT|nr:homocysteine S-methyltransferase [Flammeovirga kamogawensis]MBB6458971.1 homocysteine S-methyltransferase [Flammeovirga kamogawensis]QWG08546.1 homocysteine S-methyltransferase [Flammeovirga kamogawensis]TRX66837.1 homocysteine S-methyltransferase [Flammeovirga kamogawensis]
MKISKTILLDGGLSNALEAQGIDLNHELWSAKLLKEDEEAIVKAHLEYYLAGASCIITSSYQATIDGLMKYGNSREESIELIKKTTTLGVKAKEQALKKGVERPLFVAGSIGPFGAFLADGSEYRGDYGIGVDELKAFHKERLMLIDSTGIDVLACETIPSFDEVKAIVSLLDNTVHKGWISCSCKDGQHLNDGTPIKEVAAYLKGKKNVIAFGVNCTKPKYISSLINEIKKGNSEIDIVVYPNSGQVYHADTKTWSGISDPSHCALMAKEWEMLGASLIGGCCMMGTDHISAMEIGLYK